MPSLPDRAACARCGYLLRGLDEPRCPECGQQFDPNDARTFVWDVATTVRRHGILRVCLAVLVVAGVVAAGFSRVTPTDSKICGPLWLLQSQGVDDRYIGLLLTVLLASAITAPLLRLHVGTVILSVLGVAAWLAVGFVLCCSASV